MEIQICPQCGARVVRGGDGTCPRCRAVINDHPVRPSFVVEGRREVTRDYDETNPYAAPVATVNPFEPPPSIDDFPEVAIDQGILWLLFSFRGRLSLGMFWLASICVFICFVVLAGVVEAIFGNESVVMDVFAPWIGIPVFWIAMALLAKRWHDHGVSGWYTLIYLIPLIGPLSLFAAMALIPGSKAPNRYGRAYGSRRMEV